MGIFVHTWVPERPTTEQSHNFSFPQQCLEEEIKKKTIMCSICPYVLPLFGGSHTITRDWLVGAQQGFSML